jgi:glutathione S-transferase
MRQRPGGAHHFRARRPTPEEKKTMHLYDAPRSGNCHKVRMLLAQLELAHEVVTVDLAAGENRQPAYLVLNPRGQVPLLEDEGQLIWDSQAILVYLARRYGGETWLPGAPLAMARVMQWLAVSENEIQYGLARARAARQFEAPWNLEECQRTGRAALDLLERQLAASPWLAAGHITIADLACYPYVALAPQAGLELEGYPSVRAWIGRIQALPRYVGMSKMVEVGGG